MISILNTGGQIKVAISSLKSLQYLAADKIIRLEASNSYTKIFLENMPSIITSNVLKEYEAILFNHGFIRTHRSHLVNKRRIYSIDSMGNILMDDLSRAELSKRKRAAVIKALKG